MTLSRRRFLTISAASLVAGRAGADTTQWQGRALGGDVSLTLRGPRSVTEPALRRALVVLAQVEDQFSLFDRASALSRLNAKGHLGKPDAMFNALMQAADRLHGQTSGLFDPSVQPLWRALAQGGDTAQARRAIGWHRVRFDPDAITLAPGQALTFNGIAQGFATDLVAQVMQEAGLTQTLVNIGEYRGTGGPWKLRLDDPTHGPMGLRTLDNNSAVATSSPLATPLGGQGHILHASAPARWSTVSIEADDATTADGFSTALTLAPEAVIRGVVGRYGIRRVTLIDPAGDLTTLT